MKRSFYYTAVVSLFLIGNLLPFALEIKAQESRTSEVTETKKDRGYYLPTRIVVEYSGETVIAEKGIPEWAATAVGLINELYPRYDKLLETDGHVPSGLVTLRFEDSQTIGWNSATTIGISIRWIRPGAQGEKDFGMIAHELVHFVQSYRGGAGTGIPNWATEGIGDYVRHVFYEPEKEMRAVNPEKASYRDAYQVTAGFFMWIENTYDREFIKKLNRCARQRTYSDALWTDCTGKNLDDLWAEYVEKILKPLQQENKRLIPAIWFPNVMQTKKEFEEYFATLKQEPRPQQQEQEQGRGQGQGQGRGQGGQGQGGQGQGGQGQGQSQGQGQQRQQGN